MQPRQGRTKDLEAICKRSNPHRNDVFPLRGKGFTLSVMVPTLNTKLVHELGFLGTKCVNSITRTIECFFKFGRPDIIFPQMSQVNSSTNFPLIFFSIVILSSNPSLSFSLMTISHSRSYAEISSGSSTCTYTHNVKCFLLDFGLIEIVISPPRHA